MSKITFEDDPISRQVIRFLLPIQIGAMITVFSLILLDLFSLAFLISFLTLILFVAILIWLYLRYRKMPIVMLKRELERKHLDLGQKIRTEDSIIQSAKKKRADLREAEKREIDASLKHLQQNHIQSGLANSSIKDAAIPGVGPKLIERLAKHGIVSAAHVSNKVSDISGFGEAKREALLSWRSTVFARLDSTKPKALPKEQLEHIRQKYQIWHEKNSGAELDAQTRRLYLENQWNSVIPRLGQLVPVTFVSYLSKTLASRRLVAALIAFVLIVTQVVSSVSATTSTIVASISNAAPDKQTVGAQIPITGPTNTDPSLSTETPPPTAMPSRTQIHTLTATAAPSQTATATSTPQPTFTSQPSNTPYIPVSGDEDNNSCDPSYPGVCIPPRPPDLDCPQISYTNFTVLPPDPHGFDRDGDGIGCES